MDEIDEVVDQADNEYYHYSFIRSKKNEGGQVWYEVVWDNERNKAKIKNRLRIGGDVYQKGVEASFL